MPVSKSSYGFSLKRGRFHLPGKDSDPDGRNNVGASYGIKLESTQDMDNEHTLQLFIIEESRNDAEALANILRNAGQAETSGLVIRQIYRAMAFRESDQFADAKGLGHIVVRAQFHA